jgi:AcrR family transcriptional regulator
LRLVDCAVALFSEHGYDQVSIESVLVETGVSRGSLYHHFPGKEALFVAALEATEERIATTVAKSAIGITDPLEALRVGSNAWLELAAKDKAVRQIALIDAPSVIGWERWREIDARYALGLLKGAMQAMATNGAIPANSVELLAHTLLAMLSEIALVVARDPEGTKLAQARQVLGDVLSKLFITPP